MTASEESAEIVRSGVYGLIVREHGAVEGDRVALRFVDDLRVDVERELRQEFEDDLVRIRESTFDFGVRAVLRVLAQQGLLPPEKAKQVAVLFDAKPLDVEQFRERILPYLGPGNDDAAASDQADLVIAILRDLVP